MNTHRFRTALAGAFISLALFAPAADAARFVVKVGPPAARVEVRGHAPSPRHVWVGGYWKWNGSAHVWVSGGWNVPPRHGGVWKDGHWRRAHGGWEWIPGHWR
ncbi:MAG: YXWGXW repeat-containing protein [Holophagales bacterium]|nr:YXWGXW repeat-containing protein [Holophagales bacterium]